MMNDPVPVPEMMTVDDVATYLRVHSSTVYRMVKRRAIPCFKVARDWRFRKANIDAWIQKMVESGR
jgi:excisionase family DNA binding protein